MNRQEALEWCVENVKNFNDWQNWGEKPFLNGWRLSETVDRVVLGHPTELPITKQDWLQAKAEKEEKTPHWDAMTYYEGGEAVIYNGVKTKALNGTNNPPLEIDWNNAPEGATHYLPTEHSYEYWKEVEKDYYVYFEHGEWNNSICGLSEVKHFLIPRPTDQPYMPKVGEECEYCNPSRDDKYHWILFIGYDVDGDMVVQREDGLKGLKHREINLIFRPIKTEREKFVDAFVLDDLVCFDELAVRAIAESMYDKGYRKND